MKNDSEETQTPNYVERKCQDCGKIFEVRFDKQNSMYADYCPNCFRYNVVEHADGYLRPKTGEEKEQDLTYKDQLIGVSHRGKMKVEK